MGACKIADLIGGPAGIIGCRIVPIVKAGNDATEAGIKAAALPGKVVGFGIDHAQALMIAAIVIGGLLVFVFARGLVRLVFGIGRGAADLAGRATGATGRAAKASARATARATAATARGVGKATAGTIKLAAPVVVGVGGAYVGAGSTKESWHRAIADKLPGSKFKAPPVAHMIEHHDHSTAWPDVIDQEHKAGQLVAVTVCAKSAGEAATKVRTAYVGHRFGQSGSKRCGDSSKDDVRQIYRFTVR
jgi:hypothetical protein